MAGLLNIFNLGSKGVNVDSSPIHLEDGELTKAQNAVRDPLGSDGGLRKRPGLTKINAVAGGGGTAVVGLVNLAHEFLLTTTFYVGVEATAAGGANPSTALWRKSTTGTSFTSDTTPSRIVHPSRSRSLSGQWADHKIMLSHRNKLYFASDDYIQYPTAGYTAPPIKMWDGLVEVTVGYVPFNNAVGATTQPYSITSFAPFSADEFIVTSDDGGSPPTVSSRVFLFNPTTGTIRQIGPAAAVGSTEFGGTQIMASCTYLGRIWVGGEAFGVGSAGIYFCRPDYDTSWTLDEVLGGNYNVHSLCVYRGELYAGTRALLTAPGRIYRRDTAGTWTVTFDLGNSSGGYTQCSALTVMGDYLYAMVYEQLAADLSEQLTIRRFDGTSWTTVWTLDQGGQESRVQHPIGMGLVGPDGALYFVVPETDSVAATDANSDGLVLRSTDGTTWTEVDTFTNLRGSIGFIRR